MDPQNPSAPPHTQQTRPPAPAYDPSQGGHYGQFLPNLKLPLLRPSPKLTFICVLGACAAVSPIAP